MLLLTILSFATLLAASRRLACFEKGEFQCMGYWCWFTPHSDFIMCRHDGQQWQCIASDNNAFSSIVNAKVSCSFDENDCEVQSHCNLTYEERPVRFSQLYFALMLAFNIIMFGSIAGLAALIVRDKWEKTVS